MFVLGATNVGSVKVYFDKCLQTNIRKEVRPYCDSFSLKDEDVTLKKGDPVGEFRMGSTIVLIFEAPVNFQFNLKPGQSVKMGQSIGCITQAKYVDKIEKPNFSNVQNAS